MLRLLKNLRSYSQGKEIIDTDILNWANRKVSSAGRKRQMESFKVIENHLTMFVYMMARLLFFLWESPLKHCILTMVAGQKSFRWNVLS